MPGPAISGILPVPATRLDLTSCDREPIHIPGSVQPHGFLLGLSTGERIAVASESAETYLHRPLGSILGALPHTVLGDAAEQIAAGLNAEPLTTATRLLGALPVDGAGLFDVVAWAGMQGSEPLCILEFEQQREPADVAMLNARLFNFVSTVRRERTVLSVSECAVAEIRALTGCDRVVLYRFDEHGHGEVLAESRNDELGSLLGLRFPASDVPAQARRMYELNRVRIIPDVGYEPSPLRGMEGGAGEIDLSPSVLRSISPVHREYMRNMGTLCSMSISIMIDGRLWGLVSCHHHAPRFLPLRLRSACDFVMQIAASEIEGHEKSLRLERALAAKQVQARLLAAMAAQENYMDGLALSPGMLLQLVDARGAAIVRGQAARLFGQTPAAPDVLQLIERLQTLGKNEFFASSRLREAWPEAPEEAAGAIVISVSRLHNTHVLWFRPELIQTVRWAGNPQKPASPDEVISPRHSFAEWKETVRGASSPWTIEEVQAAQEFRSAVLEIVLSRAEDMAELAQDLQAANQELEAFSYSVSHDLRAPFRHISGFSELLRDEEGDRLSERGRRYLATIMESARFAGLLVDSLLDFSRFARAKLTVAPVDMEELVDREWAAVVDDEVRGRTIAFTRGPLPRVLGDAQLLRQVLRNLFSNAAKYTGKQSEPTVHMAASIREGELVFAVRDNGAGFDGRFAQKLFGVFQRLHRTEEFEGTGIGLANVKRIVGRHGGRVWAEGELGKGAAFYFTLPEAKP